MLPWKRTLPLPWAARSYDWPSFPWKNSSWFPTYTSFGATWSSLLTSSCLSLEKNRVIPYSFQLTIESDEASHQPPFLHTKQLQFSHALLITLIFLFFHQLWLLSFAQHSASFLQWGAESWTQYSSCGLISVKHWGTSRTSPRLWVSLRPWSACIYRNCPQTPFWTIFYCHSFWTNVL